LELEVNYLQKLTVFTKKYWFILCSENALMLITHQYIFN